MEINATWGAQRRRAGAALFLRAGFTPAPIGRVRRFRSPVSPDLTWRPSPAFPMAAGATWAERR